MAGDDEECVELTESAADLKATAGSASKLNDAIGGTWREQYLKWRHQSYKLPRHYRLVSISSLEIWIDSSVVHYTLRLTVLLPYYYNRAPRKMHESIACGLLTSSSSRPLSTQRCWTQTSLSCAHLVLRTIPLNQQNVSVHVKFGMQGYDLYVFLSSSVMNVLFSRAALT